jgi:hypothetical protein
MNIPNKDAFRRMGMNITFPPVPPGFTNDTSFSHYVVIRDPSKIAAIVVDIACARLELRKNGHSMMQEDFNSAQDAVNAGVARLWLGEFA